MVVRIFVERSTVNFGDNSSFTHNLAEYGFSQFINTWHGGGVYLRSSFGDNSNFTCNSAVQDGGGVYIYSRVM